ncbi:MAG TPA: esterase-like activity of phytase family protein, partial [Gammaproteobacteria bacterium]|nr:esterase-like activity of phytase family protein [Gammaproteobacteria bacterium]
MPNYFNFFARLAVSSLLCLVLAPQSRAGESIARIEQSGKVLANSDTAYQLTIHSVARLSNITVGKFKIAELSGLAWDSDEGLLYALSDNGYLLLLKPRFQEQQMVSLTLEDARALLDERGRPLKYKPSD